MKKNMGTADIVTRLLLAVLLSGLYFTNMLSGTVGILALVIAGIFVITGFIGVCPLYSLLGISTCKKKTI